jgi:hypothetical protein
MVAFKRWDINDFTVRGEREAITAAIVKFLPQEMVGKEVQTQNSTGSADIDSFGGGICANPFYIERFAIFIQTPGGDPSQKAMIMIYVENEEPVSAVFEIIANPRLGKVEELVLGW